MIEVGAEEVDFSYLRNINRGFQYVPVSIVKFKGVIRSYKAFLKKIIITIKEKAVDLQHNLYLLLIDLSLYYECFYQFSLIIFLSM